MCQGLCSKAFKLTLKPSFRAGAGRTAREHMRVRRQLWDAVTGGQRWHVGGMWR